MHILHQAISFLSVSLSIARDHCSTVSPFTHYSSQDRHWLICIAESETSSFFFYLYYPPTHEPICTSDWKKRSSKTTQAWWIGKQNECSSSLVFKVVYSSTTNLYRQSEKASSKSSGTKRDTKVHAKKRVFWPCRYPLLQNTVDVDLKKIHYEGITRWYSGRWIWYSRIFDSSIKDWWARTRGNRDCMSASNRTASNEPGKGSWIKSCISHDILTSFIREQSDCMPRTRKSWFDYTNVATSLFCKKFDPNKPKSKSYD